MTLPPPMTPLPDDTYASRLSGLLRGKVEVAWPSGRGLHRAADLADSDGRRQLHSAWRGEPPDPQRRRLAAPGANNKSTRKAAFVFVILFFFVFYTNVCLKAFQLLSLRIKDQYFWDLFHLPSHQLTSQISEYICP